ncbi:mandelate racemase/muconate lactonizing enzyme family protein [Bosea caraganae]|uniref:Mandelate racemase/muconate lactonizing enzyme family protein n=1 Tax=Bosea caraganae TaxID=2763117 RepID=A0A370KXY8_9HYPH|nr:mandelate racemase/muconate lactonizing enzyme family protein [Bosea caraganae]RDJ19816.1 mandelate racemase/muconate lactonizing enzyme family protein [Bosea caraganae]RDJ30044.1 mandelate racemase/muconate lactonizing enzyme family protein [Bosea caraganae]
MPPLDAIAKVESFIISIPRDVPYLGPLREGERINEKGYVIRKGNRSIYPTSDMSVLVKVTSESGKVGWGETYGIVAPQAVISIIDEVLGPVLIGRDPGDPVVLHEDLYDLMRVRGFFGGYYVDSLAGIDIAIWDLYGKCLNRPLSSLLGGTRHQTIPAYVSGLPKATLRERCDLAVEWIGKGYKAIKFAAAMSDDGIVKEMAALREAVGPEIDLMVDLHWKFTSGEAIRLIRRLEAHNLYFAEAPCEPEDIEGQEIVARGIGTPLALGEEWRTTYEYRPRFERRCMSIIQPEMGHTGVTEFLHIGRMAHAFHVDTIPHASIGIGIFMAASLQATAALKRVPYHEYQHSIFDKNLRYVTGDMGCANGAYTLPSGPGLGVEPHPDVFNYIRKA